MGFVYFEITASGDVEYIKAQINDDDMINLLVENNKSETFKMREGWHIVNSCNACSLSLELYIIFEKSFLISLLLLFLTIFINSSSSIFESQKQSFIIFL